MTQQPARAKDVKVTGRAFGANEPTDTSVDVFGVSSEIIFAGMWSGNTDARTTDANGAPTGAVTRSKVTAAGSFAFKTCGVVDESAFFVADAADENPTDVWGRPFDNHAWTGRRALFDRTNSAADDTGSALDAAETLDDPLGYSDHASETQTFDLVAAPSDATTYGYYQGFAGTSGQRDTFGLTAGASEVPGFTSDASMYGYRLQVIEYAIVRDDLAIVLAITPGSVRPGESVTGQATGVQILPDNTLIGSTFDGAPRFVLYKVDEAGQPLEQITSGAMTAIAGSDDYEFTYLPANPADGEADTYAVTVFGKVAGSRPSPGRALFTTGRPQQFTPTLLWVPTTDRDRHWQPGDTVSLSFSLFDPDGTTPTFDTDPEVAILRLTPALGLEYLESDQSTWSTFVDLPTAYLTMPSNTLTLADTSTFDTGDLILVARGDSDGAPYSALVQVETVGPRNKHGGSAVDGPGFVGFPSRS